jgi:vacuolar-type H+-ATPase subunit I/STV1
LRKILDDITFLGKLIESGQIADEALAQMKKDIDAKLNIMVTIDDFASSVNFTQTRMAQIGVDLDDLYDITEDIDDKADKSDKKINKQLDVIQKELDEVKDLLKTFNKKKFFHTHK